MYDYLCRFPVNKLTVEFQSFRDDNFLFHRLYCQTTRTAEDYLESKSYREELETYMKGLYSRLLILELTHMVRREKSVLFRSEAMP